MTDLPQFLCDDDERRDLVRNPSSGLNGIDYLEVVDNDAPTDALRQRTLLIFFLKPVIGLTRDNIRIEGGTRIRNIKVEWAHPASAIPGGLLTPAEAPFFAALPEPDNILVVRVNTPGDFSTYRLRLVISTTNTNPPAGIDPPLSQIDFSFKVECPSDFDCEPTPDCPPEVFEEPEIDYLAKDYNSFRRLVLDRMSLLMPGWQDRNASDVQVMLAELVAYLGDGLSYYQDAVATESYLDTALHRPSIRRHTRLLDYYLHEGCNARAWVCFELSGDDAFSMTLPAGTKILSRGALAETVIDPDPNVLTNVLADQPVVFETMYPVTLRPAHNTLDFYTWGDKNCCLPRGATRATLKRTSGMTLSVGDILLFEEVISPATGAEADADRTHRHVVRLTRADIGVDQASSNQPIVEIAWATEDALPFSLCVSALVRRGDADEEEAVVAVARANVVLADHGLSLEAPDDPPLGGVPSPLKVPSPLPRVPRLARAVYRPRLPSVPYGPVTHRETITPGAFLAGLRSAVAALQRDPTRALPVVELTGDDATWRPVRDLLSSNRFSPEFVVEVENDGTADLRFGDGLFGRKPGPNSAFIPEYRVGNGRAGNVGAETLVRIVLAGADGIITGVRNPMAAQGGTDPAPMERARLDAPYAFRTQERAVTMADYAEVAERHPGVQRAAATLRWTGSWYTVFVTVDRVGGEAVDKSFEADLMRFMDRYRMAGIDLEIDGPTFVPLEIVFEICVKAGYFRADVKAALLTAFSNRAFSDGRRGFFHPDNFTFGQPVYLSQLYYVAENVAGVESVVVKIFKRMGKLPNREIEDGILTLSRLEIARLDNDPSLPENGKLTFEMKGGL